MESPNSNLQSEYALDIEEIKKFLGEATRPRTKQLLEKNLQSLENQKKKMKRIKRE